VDVLLVQNPSAGGGGVGPDELIRLLRGAGHRPRHLSTEGAWQEVLAREAVEFVAVAGGDGTVRQVITALADRSVAVGIIATGTANNVARTLAVPVNDPLRSIELWEQERRRPFHVPAVTSGTIHHRFVEAVGGGVVGELLHAAEHRKRAEGSGGGNLDGLRMLEALVERAPARWWSVDADGQDLSGEYLAVEVMNIQSIGPNVLLAPCADPSAPTVELVLVGEAQRAALAHIVRGLLDREPLAALPDVRLPVFTASKARLEVPPVAVHLDDIPLGHAVAGGLTVTVGGSSLEVFVP
jgi:diacylglycerol kinase (ATP)